MSKYFGGKSTKTSWIHAKHAYTQSIVVALITAFINFSIFVENVSTILY